MGLYNFQPRFVPYILEGSKTHTIRAPRKRPEDVPGNTMHLYAGLRHKGARLLGRFECVRVEDSEIAAVGPQGVSVWVDGVVLDCAEKDLLAWRDGFRPSGCTADGINGTPKMLIANGGPFRMMMQFWDQRLPFRGHIFHWRRGTPPGKLDR